jgi:hypothetical protein
MSVGNNMEEVVKDNPSIDHLVKCAHKKINSEDQCQLSAALLSICFIRDGNDILKLHFGAVNVAFQGKVAGFQHLAYTSLPVSQSQCQ